MAVNVGQLENETQTTPESGNDVRGRGLSEPLLLDPLKVVPDTRLISRAVKKRWKLSDEKKDDIIERLAEIVGKHEVTVMTKLGPESIDGPADVNAIMAARVLVEIEGQVQADELPASGTTVNVGVNLGLYEERVAGRNYDELRAELIKEAAAMTRRLEDDAHGTRPA